MDYQQLLETLTPDIFARLKAAIETGRWPDGRAVTPRQREHALQAAIAWGEQHLPPEQRIGYIDKGRKDPARQPPVADAPQPLRWRNDTEQSDG